MKVTLVPSAFSGGGTDPHQFSTSYLLNDTLAIDAGCLGFYRSPFDQARIRHVLLSHSHIDHIASLPIFIENAYEGKPDCVTIHGSDAVLDCLHKDIFNDRVWPDFIGLSKPQAPFLKLATLEADKAVELEGLRITPVTVDHVVPTFGFIVEDQGAAVVIPTDTGPTDAIWQRANATPNLKAVFLEATFPNNMTWLADVSKHLTPAKFALEVQKIQPPVALIAVHIKPRFRAQVVNELQALALPQLEIGQFAKPYQF
jgi:ribonuclease BN (tRNA processing enzyme)